MRKAAIIVAALVIALMQLTEQRGTAQLGPGSGTSASNSAQVDPLIVNHFNLKGGLQPIPVVITYKSMPSTSELNGLQLAGITKGIKMRELPMVIAPMNAAQLASVRTQPGVKSIWANRIMKPFTNESRRFIGVPQMMADRDVQRTNVQNPGMPISGKGVGIGYIDTGVDATHADLKYGTKTVQNVIQPHSETTVGDGGLLIGIGINVFDEVYVATGFNPPIYVENTPHSDVESGHGTHGAAVAAGTGAQSGTFYGGVAPGAHLIGLNAGNELGLPLVTILSAYDYLLVNQFVYNIRIINNSWGSSLSAQGISPDDPINIATRTAHDRNIVVVFAAGNSGDEENAINPYSTMPWTISVAAGEKRGLGTPAGFSSRGVNNGEGTDVAGMPADPEAMPNLRPDVTAPGVDIKSARMKGVGLTNTIGAIPLFVGANDLTTIPPAYLPYYTTSQGTSFACPHVAGVVALMLEAQPTLTPDEVVTILRQTATPMPYEERVVGAGYVDAHNAVRRVLGLSAVAHPFNLFPQPGGPEIVDPEGDQYFGLGVPASAAQDVLWADYAYDAATRQIVYTIALKSTANLTPNMRWTQSSIFTLNNQPTTIFVTTSIDELGARTYQYGKIVILATGTRQQTRLGAADSGEIVNNKIIVRLSIDKLSAATALGYDPVGMTSTSTEVLAQILVGTTPSGGLLFAADVASGGDFKVE
ncbi:MAG: S8 family peptidase [Acidobacteriota bacterium]